MVFIFEDFITFNIIKSLISFLKKRKFISINKKLLGKKKWLME